MNRYEQRSFLDIDSALSWINHDTKPSYACYGGIVKSDEFTGKLFNILLYGPEVIVIYSVETDNE